MSSSSQHETQTGRNSHLCPFHEARAQAAFSRVPTESEPSESLPTHAPVAATGYSPWVPLSEPPEPAPPRRVQHSCVMGIEVLAI